MDRYEGCMTMDQSLINYPLHRVRLPNGQDAVFEMEKIRKALAWACKGYETDIDHTAIIEEMARTIFDGITLREIEDALILATTVFIEQDAAYSTIAARLLRKKLYKEVVGATVRELEESAYQESFIRAIVTGVTKKIFDERLLSFDLELLAQSLELEGDDLFEYMGLRTLYERYFAKIDNQRVEMPQAFWMRVAMGLAIEEEHKNERAIEFYRLMSRMRYVPSTPTLLHSGLVRSQLSSCYLSTVEDDLSHIFKCIGDNAQLSKWSGGVANDWSNIRAIGSYIDTIKVESQGVIPFLRIANDTTAAINRSGKRRSASVVYLEVWHYEIEDFLDLRRNTGDERRRTHDISTANWIPDLFMKRVIAEDNWTLFSPDEVPELHHVYGRAFEQKYEEYEQKAHNGQIRLYKVVEAKALWRKMLSRLFETGHPWLTFKDPSNIRSPQDHVGVVHCSNLCTEITLNTSAQETAVCNLGSVNLSQHIVDGTLDEAQLGQTVTTAMRMLDNVIDINFYPTQEARYSNMLHRPVGLGQMGLQDALYKLNICFDDPQALEFADMVTEKIAYHAIFASSQLAKERGAYSSYKGSKWDRNLLPQDTIALLEQERGVPIECGRVSRLDWTPVRESIRQYGMRNSNCMAIAPTATIANIAGCFPSIEPIYKNLYVKANMTGEFTVINKYLIEDLKACGLWNQEIRDQIKYYDGSVQMIEVIPAHIRNKYKEAFEIEAEWLIDITAARSKWIDQSQSHNVFLKGISGAKLDNIYKGAWRKGLKTTYYLRTLGASQNEKSTLDAKKFGFTQKRTYTTTVSSSVKEESNGTIVNSDYQSVTVTSEAIVSEVSSASYQSEFLPTETLDKEGASCRIDNPDCEACQ